MKIERKMSIISVIFGALVGFICGVFPFYPLALGILSYVAMVFLAFYLLKGRKIDWYLSNTWLYFVIWILVWTILYNV
jgi:hypothetical protein